MFVLLLFFKRRLATRFSISKGWMIRRALAFDVLIIDMAVISSCKYCWKEPKSSDVQCGQLAANVTGYYYTQLYWGYVQKPRGPVFERTGVKGVALDKVPRDPRPRINEHCTTICIVHIDTIILLGGHMIAANIDIIIFKARRLP